MGRQFEPGQRVRLIGDHGPPTPPIQATVMNATDRELRLRLEGREPQVATPLPPSRERPAEANTPRPLPLARYGSLDRRADRHYPVWWPCLITGPGAAGTHPAVVIDVSEGGVAIETSAPFTSERLLLTLQADRAKKCELRCAVIASEESWRGAVLHVAFEELNDQQQVTIGKLIDRWRDVFDEAQSYLVSSPRIRERPGTVDDRPSGD